MSAQPVQYQPRYKPLLSCLVTVFLAYSMLYYVEQALSRRDYSLIPNAETRVGYCMAASVSPYEKHTLAQSIARPNSSEVYSIVLAYSLVGEVTPQKRGAIRALREREELRQRATQIALRAADHCGYDRIALAPDLSPWKIMERWLSHDNGFAFFLDRAKLLDPDEAEQAYRSALRKSQSPAARKS